MPVDIEDIVIVVVEAMRAVAGMAIELEARMREEGTGLSVSGRRIARLRLSQVLDSQGGF